LIGFASTLILARLLIPEDFGIVAMASLVIALIDVFLDLGVNVALIQNQDASASHYNTAWTLRLLQAMLAAVVVLVAAPFAGDYFNDSRVVAVLQFMAVGLLLAGIENIGIVAFQKEMRFGLEFRFLFARRIFGFFVTIAAAWILRSYWALVIGSLAGRAFGVLLSYAMHPMRPRIGFRHVEDIISISLWTLAKNIGIHLDNSLHKILVGGRTSASTMGAYSIADEIAVMPATEMLAPVNRALFPAFVLNKNDRAMLTRMFLLAQSIQTLIAIPASVGLALVAPEVVRLLLGDKWLIAVPFIQVLAVSNVIQSIYTSGGYVMITLDRSRDVAVLAWFQFMLFALIAVVLMPEADALRIASIRVLTVLCGLALAIVLLMRTLKTLTLTDLLRSVYRPLIASVLMTIAVLSCDTVVGANVLLGLVIKVSIGFLVYTGAIGALWVVVGRPDGGESYIIKKALELARR
jgi:polysaccharide transporter, PST family